ncbi:beta-lactamase family protein [Exilibacterium tricleocarpae]|uniref:Beta-lactamase family protein n=1 Tax=Exilibacterium tricleocarpae TaxID=2591008 RepID=A0A545TBF9_9GAMM|nr:serine hydrolase domain-containing protein [Exilibacterium tricleocarpae]TQV74549.1 beta-lactamase family protein [Exilibacterium tricleocarpae]
MNNIISTVWVLIFASSAFAKDLPSTRPERQGFSSERLDRITQVTRNYVEQGKLAGAVTMVARRGEIVHFEAVGQRGASDDSPLKKDDLFRIYSMTKPIVVAATMQLYEQGKFHLNDPVSKFVPELKDLQVLNPEGVQVPAEQEMTMQQLLTHTSGLSYGFNPTTDPIDQHYADAKLTESESLDDFVNRLAKLPLKFQPGHQWHYSVATDVAGLIVERISGQPLDQYLYENIFEPLDMEDTFFEVPDDKLHRFLPNHFLHPETGELAQIPDENLRGMAAFRDVKLFSGGAGLVSSTMDYMKFAEVMRNGGELNGRRILGTKTVKFMATNHLQAGLVKGGSGEQPTQNPTIKGFGFGLGFGVVTDPTAAGVIGSAGEYYWGGAAGTVFWIDPVEDLAVIGMIQLMGSPYPFRADLKTATYQALTESLE